ncbi:MAG TPA: DUF928 domain-containing protein [Oculatellaceae cyanobacterium]
MNLSTTIFRLISVFLPLSVVLAPDSTTKVWAEYQVVASFEPPPGQPVPRDTVGAGSRPLETACLSTPSATSGSLTALSPGRHLGLTQVDRPNFLVYKPQTKAETAEFSLFDEQMNGIYQVSISVSKQAGLVRIHLPDTAPSLLKDKPYYWTLALVCNSTDRTEDLVVGGWIQHTQLNDNLKQQLANVAAVEKVSLYAKQGFWYDALNILVELQRTEPNNPKLAATRAELLKSVSLDAIATKLLE